MSRPDSLTIPNDCYRFSISRRFAAPRWYRRRCDRGCVAVHRYCRPPRDVEATQRVGGGNREEREVEEEDERSARIVGGGSQRGPTERRQQAESLAHSFSVPLARSRLLSHPLVFLSLFPFPRSPSRWSSLRSSLFRRALRLLCPPTTDACERARIRARVRMCVMPEEKGGRGVGRPRIASLWDSLTTAGVFPRF